MNTFYAANVIAKLYLYIRQSWRKFSLAELIRRKVRFSVKGGEEGGRGEGRGGGGFVIKACFIVTRGGAVGARNELINFCRTRQ